MSIEAMKLAAEFNRYFTSGNGVDVPAKVSVSRDEWRALLTTIQQVEAQQPATGEPVAYGFPNTAITGRKQALMMVALDVPSGDQYGGSLWVPLYTHPAPTVPAAWTKDLFLVVHAMEMNNWHWKSTASNDLKREAHEAATRLYTASKIAAPSVPDDVVHLRNALILAANRLDRLTLELKYDSQARADAIEWASDAMLAAKKEAP